MSPKASQTLESENQDSLVSSETLPELGDLQKEYDNILLEMEEEKPKAKTGRKKKEEPSSSGSGEAPPIEPQILPNISAKEIEPWVCLPLDMLFKRDGKSKLSKEERQIWSESCANVLNKWAPLIGSRFGAEIGLALTAIFIVGVRYSPLMMEEPPIEHATDSSSRS